MSVSLYFYFYLFGGVFFKKKNIYFQVVVILAVWEEAVQNKDGDAARP